MKETTFTIQCNSCGSKREVKTDIGYPPDERAVFINIQGNITIRCTGCPGYITIGWRNLNG